MRGLSKAAMAQVEARFNVLAASADLGSLAEELFAIAGLFDREHGLRRNMSDPARPAELKAEILRSLLNGKVSDTAIEVAVAAVEAKWSRAGDLPDALERLGVTAAAAEAESFGEIDDLEDELFRFGRILAAYPELRRALSDPNIPGDRKRALLTELLEGKVTRAALRLITQLVVHPRGRSLESALDEYGWIVARLKERLVGVVRSAVPLTEEQKQRLAAWLRATYGREVHLNVEVDPKVLGGFSVQIGDHFIDTTIAGRIEDVRRRLAG
ncbi:F0F1 ATP synthase subunit delta [Thermobispora bispora]|jgi:F-type H+-transporting ATPase subunit delta|uniref:ATP synthase subunit delta n=1 Tax=Thermobispora bispora (strain ATCC 19993 / DSM 43833 / CBS 139.67 / JCM 10125 / KCTC 9307 / NBRC 14880 / R51) TaxID=469371 RepID=D6Y726_THEBD|nr:F0F1 ATP synthase subunit delta [Thermobispora bispora]MBO2472958.1 F0F1 ATP synthase subunit delta [Actinomycetales bacterium]MDI9580237.1 F0F1 ATP synthase subunit delta [Thermobispora sp.]ADG87621.1 ATP synthase F1, delta subunit [Thermobispora bispora DSM 43833]MBX6166332.1 F0F1 ATP synthase subunit delta [Thermobispora bispora]QSI47539.1 F0F1 ATP synthase subunit delta [Thermobispora bispora]